MTIIARAQNRLTHPTVFCDEREELYEKYAPGVLCLVHHQIWIFPDLARIGPQAPQHGQILGHGEAILITHGYSMNLREQYWLKPYPTNAYHTLSFLWKDQIYTPSIGCIEQPDEYIMIIG